MNKALTTLLLLSQTPTDPAPHVLKELTPSISLNKFYLVRI